MWFSWSHFDYLFFFLFFFFFCWLRSFCSSTSVPLPLLLDYAWPALDLAASKNQPTLAASKNLVPFLSNFFLLADTKKVQENSTNFSQNSKSDQFIVHWHCHCVFVWCLSLLLSNTCQCAVKWRCHWGCGWQRLFLHHRLKRQKFQRCNIAFFESCWDWKLQSFCKELFSIL